MSEANSGENNDRSKKVRCVETGEVFISEREAAKFINRNESGIAKCCRGIQKTCGKLHWEFVIEEKL